MKTGLMAGASRFAHFAGLSRASRRAAEDQDDDGKQGRRADDDDGKEGEDEDEPKGKRSGRAADDDDDDGKESRRASDDDDDDDGKESRRAADDDGDDEDEPKGRRSRRAADDDDKDAEDDDEDEMKGKGAVASARRREQARIAHILGHKAAGGNPVLAVSLACETRMTRREAVRVLRSTPATQQAEDDRPNRHARTDRASRNVRLGSDASAPSGRQAVEASWDKAFASAGVVKKR